MVAGEFAMLLDSSALDFGKTLFARCSKICNASGVWGKICPRPF